MHSRRRARVSGSHQDVALHPWNVQLVVETRDLPA